VSNPPHLDGIAQGTHDVILPNQFGKLLGPPPAGYNLIGLLGHTSLLIAFLSSGKRKKI
jgi:hypothetical protein